MNKTMLFMFSIFMLTMISCHDTPYTQGKRLYLAKCANCHMEDGSGLSKLIPAIQTSTMTYSGDLVCLLYSGKSDTIYEGNTFLVKEMPAFKELSATEVTNIINYINHKWHKNFVEKSILETSQQLNDCIK